MNVSGFAHQVGGHFGIFACGGHICKPFNTREVAFYEQIGNRFAPFTPKCCGVVNITLEATENNTCALRTDDIVSCHPAPGCSADQVGFQLSESGQVEAEPHHNLWARQCQNEAVKKFSKSGELFLLLESAVCFFTHPCVIDLKMGTRQYGDDADEGKRESHTNKCLKSTSSSVGIRIAGMQLYIKESGLYWHVDKYVGLDMSVQSFHDTLTEYLMRAGKLRCHMLLSKLHLLQKRLRDAKGFRFFSSSLLIAFDGNESYDETIDLRMIDFAHSTFSGFFNDATSYSGPDEGYLFGLSSLISSVESVLYRLTKAAPRDDS